MIDELALNGAAKSSMLLGVVLFGYMPWCTTARASEALFRARNAYEHTLSMKATACGKVTLLQVRSGGGAAPQIPAETMTVVKVLRGINTRLSIRQGCRQSRQLTTNMSSKGHQPSVFCFLSLHEINLTLLGLDLALSDLRTPSSLETRFTATSWSPGKKQRTKGFD